MKRFAKSSQGKHMSTPFAISDLNPQPTKHVWQIHIETNNGAQFPPPHHISHSKQEEEYVS
ncbi:hypothetical protein LOK49_LG03G02268 [Camellia lanceoleosa]|uniref:Uncharacterized protein n=1 Tax=Camellia lanceoleosa TaxID=1840588 RepID=A0ACC0I7I0_9ERIC|nr:hypothetical protein LOK49_LG03G02268 [Camellia lanceoleosa]